MSDINKTDVAFSWMDTDRLSVIEDLRRFESLEEAAAYNHSLYCEQLRGDDNAAELDVEDFVEALREIIEREGLNEKDGSDLRTVWESLDTPVFLVLDEDGDNVAYAQVRQFGAKWLYVDSVDGFEILESVDDLRLSPVDED